MLNCLYTRFFHVLSISIQSFQEPSSPLELSPVHSSPLKPYPVLSSPFQPPSVLFSPLKSSPVLSSPLQSLQAHFRPFQTFSVLSILSIPLHSRSCTVDWPRNPIVPLRSHPECVLYSKVYTLQFPIQNTRHSTHSIYCGLTVYIFLFTYTMYNVPCNCTV